MGIANFPFPSFTFVLMSDRVIIPGPSYVIRLAPLVVLHPHTPQTTALMMTHIANWDVEEEMVENDSIADVALGHSDHEEEEPICNIPEIISTVETIRREKEVENKLSFMKMRRFRLKSIFKRLPMVTYMNA